MSQQLSGPPPLSPPENAAARTWIEKFTSKCIPRDEVEVTFARSSGPGGQHVNKVNTKASVRCSIDRAWLPEWAKEHLMRSPAYVASSRSLLITSTQHRSQAQNVEDCFIKLHNIIHTASLAAVPTPPDAARLARKAAYEHTSKARNRIAKMHRSAVKAGRRER
ncbi:RF-1 domain-containing protein [Hysterangium stoloniferum]|nr:RF-1 domain-containing protein [Hysterangium stoloniferum]